jgi:predicted TIM-barrel fold metal-dependent hydrolase
MTPTNADASPPTLLDANAWLGHYPFRAVPNNTPEGLLRLMDRHDIAQALVGSVHSAFYSDAHSANEELARWVRPYRDRLIPCATLNPAYPGWERDLRQCTDEWGMRGLRLFPAHHRFSLGSPRCLELVRAATQLGLHIAIPVRLEDRRQQHWMDSTAEVSLDDIADLVRRCPDAHLLVLEAVGVENSPFVQDPSLSNARVSFEFSRMASVLHRSIPKLLERLGPSRLVFGTGMPLKIPGPAILKLSVLDAAPDVKALLAAGNMRRLLSAGDGAAP